MSGSLMKIGSTVGQAASGAGDLASTAGTLSQEEGFQSAMTAMVTAADEKMATYQAEQGVAGKISGSV